MTTKAEATRWLEAHVGLPLHTNQVRRNFGWVPGPRVLTRKGRRFYLDESEVSRLGPAVTIDCLTETMLVFTDSDWGQTTTYSTEES